MRQHARPLALLLALGVGGYLPGLAIARYLGVFRSREAAAGGALWLAFVIGGGYALAVAFASPPRETAARQRWLNAAFVLWAGAALLTIALAWNGLLPTVAAWLAFCFAAGALALTVPPLRWLDKGYGEVLLAAGAMLLAPALAFALQTGALHRLVGMTGLPLFVLALAALLVWDFPNYAAHLKAERRTLLMRLDWRLAFRLHNVALLTGFLLLAADVWLGMPADIVLPCTVALLAAAGQVWVLQRVAAGWRPPWGWLRANAVLIVALVDYFLTFGFWRL